MAKNSYIGLAPALAQVWKGALNSNAVGETFTVTLTDLDDGAGSITQVYTYTVSSADTTTTLAAANFAAAWNKDSRHLVSRITAASSGAEITLTSDIAGQPFSAAHGGSGTWTATPGVTTAGGGPNDIGLPGNWSERALPVAADDICLPAGAPSLLYNLELLNGFTAGKFYSEAGFSGNVGRRENGREYKLKLKPTVCEIRGRGSCFLLNLGAQAIEVVCEHSGKPTLSDQPVINVVGSAITKVSGCGHVGVAAAAGDTATVTGSFNPSGGRWFIGHPLSTLTVAGASIRNQDAVVTSWAGIATVTQIEVAGSAEYREFKSPWTTGAFYDGKAFMNVAGTYANTTVENEAVLDTEFPQQAHTLTNSTRRGRAQIRLPADTTIYTNPTSPIGAKGGPGWEA
ncbi:hypothetical protein RAS1_14430 [Phycisphaerae bacterium RAS1]|nr:hypothetical protein RAS1_14430 [Phycisphaerae bacterium RAS1]